MIVTTPPTPIKEAHPGRLLFRNRYRVQFNKPHKTLEEQLALLISRGLTVSDEEKARHYLEHLNYYRLTAYWIPFQKNSQTHEFKSGTTFEDILNLYIFDREFRLLLLDAIERIEVSVRSKWAYYLCKEHGAHAHLNPNLFKDTNKWTHSNAVKELEKTVSKSQEIFIVHLREKYQEALPPLWALVEIMTFGQLSHWYEKQKYRQDRNAVAHLYNFDEKNLVSFLHHLNFIRNKCAHHNRIWNREATIIPKLPNKRPKIVVESLNLNKRRKIYNTLVVIAYLLDIISPNHHWKNNFFTLTSKHKIDISRMGFPKNFATLPIWNN